MKRKIVSVLLCVLLLASLLPVSAFADTTASGTCGDNLTWTLDGDGTLTISGTGKMWDYDLIPDNGSYRTSAPWGKCYSSITSIVINDGITSIGYGAFYNCSSLTSVTIGNGVTSIGNYAFDRCSNLTSVTIPDSVTSIGGWAFYNCSSLTSVTIGNGVTSIGNYAFDRCSNLTSVTIPDSVTSIGGWAFYNCSSLTSVTIPDSVTSIGSEAFCDCSKIKVVKYDGNIESWLGIDFGGNYSNPCTYGSTLYFKGELVTNAVIPDSITSIKNWSFYGCSSLTSVTIPDSVTSIGDYAFCDCSSLTSVTIPDSVTSIGGCAFENCSNLTSVTIGNGVRSIGDYAFWRCSSLTSVTIGNGVTSIGSGAFLGCSSLTSVTIPDGVTSIEGSAFYGCSSLTSATIPHGVTSIGERAFSDCSSLTSVTIPDSVTSIGSYAFCDCSSLTSATIPHGVTSIGERAFSDCSSLTSVTIPDSVTSIGSGAFYNCSSLTSVTIGNSVTSIGDYAFLWCSKLKDIAFAGSKDAWASIEKGYEAFSTSPRIHYNCTTLEGHIIPMERKDPSCTSTGYIKYSCACGYEFTDTLPENHDYVFIKSVAATCSNAGYDVYKCSKCGKILNKSNGEEQLPHDYELTKAVEPTCTEHGYDVYKCTVCGTSKTETRNDELLPHDYVVTVVEPTCLKGGYTLHKCSVCGDEYKDNLTAFLGHSMVEVGEKPATCNEAGHTAGVQCSRCGLVESGVTEITALGHSYGNWTQTKAPTCTAKGTETGRCTRCNATETRDVNALGHDIVYHAAKAATCTEKGWAAYDTCSRCDYTTYKEIPATGHHHNAVVTAPTCTEKGYTTHICACGDTYVDSYTDALGHSYANGKCTRCGAADPNYKPAPKAPELKITTSAGKPKIYWNAVDGAVKYWVYRSTDGKNFKYYDSTKKTSYTNSSTSIGTTYYYKVKAVNANGAASDYSVSKSIQRKPAAPTVSINRSNGKPKLSWKAVSGAKKYWIYRSTDGKNFKYWDSTTMTSYTNSGAASGTKYYYRVKAVAVVNGKNVVSANSSTKSLFTSLAKPSVSITTSNGKPKLTWKAVTGADKYYIYRSTDGKTFSYWDSTTKTSYVNSGAKKNTKYYYKVKAVCASNSNANSAQSSTVSIKATK